MLRPTTELSPSLSLCVPTPSFDVFVSVVFGFHFLIQCISSECSRLETAVQIFAAGYRMFGDLDSQAA